MTKKETRLELQFVEVRGFLIQAKTGGEDSAERLLIFHQQVMRWMEGFLASLDVKDRVLTWCVSPALPSISTA